MFDRDETIKRIRTALKRRSGKPWSVTGGRGTAWGWITIDAPPARRCWRRERYGSMDERGDYQWRYVEGEPGAYMGPDDRAELAKLLGIERVYDQGESIPSSGDYYDEYIDRAEGRTPRKVGVPYWD